MRADEILLSTYASVKHRCPAADDIGGMARLANYLGEQGRYGPALELQLRVLGAQERLLGAEHPDTLDTREILARCTGEAGDPAAARDQLTALLAIRARVLGADHPDTMDTRHILAYWADMTDGPAATPDQLTPLPSPAYWTSRRKLRSTM
jgi:hypothetical protein